jgi:cytochrome b involved in lipid metabolism
MSEQTTIYTIEEVSVHNTEQNLWVALNGKVYNLTEFVAKHPGGQSALANVAGTDITDCFTEIESHVNSFSYIQKILPDICVGELRTK